MHCTNGQCKNSSRATSARRSLRRSSPLGVGTLRMRTKTRAPQRLGSISTSVCCETKEPQSER
eukprot:2624196-Alexandrium_andersonii.AAC.1